MVDSIKGPGTPNIVIIKTHGKQKPQKATESGNSFEKTLKDKAGKASTDNIDRFIPSRTQNLSEQKIALLANQQLSRMQHLADITQQVQNGTYKIVDPYVLAERLVEVFTNKKTRDKFIKKLLSEEAEGLTPKGSSLSNLEVKKILQLVKDSQDVSEEDPELEAFLKDFS